MSIIKDTIGKVRDFFTKQSKENSAVLDGVYGLLSSWGLTSLHVEHAMREIVELKSAELVGSEKTKAAAMAIVESHDASLVSDSGIRWPEIGLQYITQVIQLVYLIAKITRRI